MVQPLEAGGLSSFLQPGSRQLAAGFFVYGPQLALVLTLGSGARIFLYSPLLGSFVDAYGDLAVPQRAAEFAVNALQLPALGQPHAALVRRTA